MCSSFVDNDDTAWIRDALGGEMFYFPDVSKWQGDGVDWKTLTSQRDVACIRAMYGTGVDVDFVRNRTAAHANGIGVLGMYHYVVKGTDVATQARAYLNAIGTLAPNEFDILDLEDDMDLASAATTWFGIVEAAHKRQATCYSGDQHLRTDVAPYTTQNAALVAAVGTRPRWVARYSVSKPFSTYDAWQYSETDTGEGIPGQHDDSRYEGTLDQFKARFLGTTPVQTATPDPEEEDPMLYLFIRASASDLYLLSCPGGLFIVRHSTSVSPLLAGGAKKIPLDDDTYNAMKAQAK